ncbi:MAG TPA: histidinol-phosphate transaminase [Steroidobacteraceae bacterium]|nr:histidinol-phosphate transaminase [Steroidobacteraceae bacterium]
MSWVHELARADIVALEPYAHASWEASLERLHANELPWRPATDASGAGLNRYPEPQPRALIERLAELYSAAPDSILVGRGSDEAIDLLIRAFCHAGRDAVLICPPTFGMYAVCARIQGAEVVQVPLLAARGFALESEAVLDHCTAGVKLVFLCSPNNPTANLLDEAQILRIACRLLGRALVVVDEAYIEFAGVPSLARLVPELPNLAILRTLSKAHGLAGARCGALIAHREVIALLRKIIPPYAIAQPTLEAVLEQLTTEALAHSRARLAQVIAQRERLLAELPRLAGVARVWPSAANFVLAEFEDAGAALARAREARLLVRDARGYPGLGRALRVTVGTPEQNGRLLEAWA